MVEVEQWAEIRRMHHVCGLSIKEIVRRTGRDRKHGPAGAAVGALLSVAAVTARVYGVAARSGPPWSASAA